MAKTPKSTLVRFTDTSLRDAHQSLWATRMRTDDILQIAETVDKAGYYSLECWGGATFDVCLRFLRENPWERLRAIKSVCKTPLQMLLRGQNILGYRHYADDAVERFIALACENGIDIFRVFDALNDVRNLETAMKAVKKYGGHAQGTISYTVSPVHTVETYVRLASDLKNLGADSLCIKDMAGILAPAAAQRLVQALAKVGLPIQIHSHMTSGMAPATYLAAVQAGAGAIDCACGTLSGISSQPATETMAAILSDAGYDTGLDMQAVREENAYFRKLKPSRAPKSSAAVEVVDVGVLTHHIPGGMISNLRSQLAQQDALDRLPEVMEELPKARRDLGYPPLVTPTSQIVGVQSVLNVLTGKRFEQVTKEVTNYVKGLYGRPPAPIDPKLVKKILGKAKPIDCRPADLLEPELPKAAKELDPKLVQKEEDILSYCLFPAVALDYFKWRAMPPDARAPIPADLEMEAPKKAQSPAQVDPELARLAAIGKTAAQLIRQVVGNADLGAIPEVPLPSPEPVQAEKPAAPEPQGETIDSPLNGTFFRADAPGKPNIADEGKTLSSGDPICVIEAMKLFNPVKVSKACRLVKFLVQPGDHVSKGQPIAVIE
ncbi:MAG: pyruvate carboxylase subunit B [Kiritimatiellia bacterium]